MGISSNCLSSKSDMSTNQNFAENMQGKNEFARFRILLTEVGEHIFDIYSLVMLTQLRSQGLSSYRLERAKRDPGTRWARVSQNLGDDN